MNKPNLITPHGGYRNLKSFQHAELVYDATVKFCERLEQAFLNEGGFTERLYQARSAKRRK